VGFVNKRSHHVFVNLLMMLFNPELTD